MNEADMKLAGDLLQIKLKPKHLELFWRHISKPSDDACWEWQIGLTNRGYGKIKIRPKTITAHRFSFIIHNFEMPKMVLHSCDNRKCVNPRHLRSGDHIENMSDMKERKRQAYGAKHGLTHFTDDDVMKIRELYANKVPIKVIASLFNIKKGSVSNIACGRCWSHLPNAQPVRRPNAGQWRKKLLISQI